MMIDGITKTSRPLYFFHFRTLLNFGFQSFYLGKFDHDLTATSLGIMVNKGNHPQMAELFRLVKYYFIYPDLIILSLSDHWLGVKTMVQTRKKLTLTR